MDESYLPYLHLDSAEVLVVAVVDVRPLDRLFELGRGDVGRNLLWVGDRHRHRHRHRVGVGHGSGHHGAEDDDLKMEVSEELARN